jgi:hypothetical protein
VIGPSVAVVSDTRTVVVERPPAYVIERTTGFITNAALLRRRQDLCCASRGLVEVVSTVAAWR